MYMLIKMVAETADACIPPSMKQALSTIKRVFEQITSK